MSRKLVLTTFFVTILIGALGLSFEVQRAEASGTIYIRADGSIDPPTAPISTVDNVTYTFTGNINDSIVVERDNIVVDGAGCTVQGTGALDSKGMDLSERTNVTVRNTQIQASWYGIWLSYASNNSIVGNNITANSDAGVRIDSSGNEFYHNNFNNTRQLYDPFSQRVNVWDDGYPSGGNYWSDLNPADVFSGSYQNETGSDKIGDTPYIIDANNTDSYPLIHPYGYVPSPDFNNDGIIDIFDLVRLAPAFGSVPGVPNWDPYFDLNQDSIIDIFDLVTVAVNFGKQWTPP